jgi:hypothetical protein
LSPARSSGPPRPEPSLPEKVVSIHKALRSKKIPHAIGGALALAYYAEPRATIDIDLNVFVPTMSYPLVIGALSPLGVKVDDLNQADLERDGQCRLWWDDNPVDLFFSYDEIHEEMRKEVRKVPFADTSLPILAPEHLAVCKAMFDRPKDWIDIEQMLVATDDLDVVEIERQLNRMVGPENPRLQRLAELKSKLAIES